MNSFQQVARSYVTIGVLTFLLCFSLSGMAFSAESKIDLNAATAQQLEQLPGIGKEIAERIVNYRKDVGPFKSVDELAKVKGIGQGKLTKVRNLLTIGVASQSPSSK